MQVNEQGLANKKQWEDKGYSLPGFDRAAVSEKTRQNPFWVHFGAGNIFRAFQAKVVQDLLNEGVLDRGLVVAEGFDYEIIEKMNHPHDDYNIPVSYTHLDVYKRQDIHCHDLFFCFKGADSHP